MLKSIILVTCFCFATTMLWGFPYYLTTMEKNGHHVILIGDIHNDKNAPNDQSFKFVELLLSRASKNSSAWNFIYEMPNMFFLLPKKSIEKYSSIFILRTGLAVHDYSIDFASKNPNQKVSFFSGADNFRNGSDEAYYLSSILTDYFDNPFLSSTEKLSKQRVILDGLCNHAYRKMLIQHLNNSSKIINMMLNDQVLFSKFNNFEPIKIYFKERMQNLILWLDSFSLLKPTSTDEEKLFIARQFNYHMSFYFFELPNFEALLHTLSGMLYEYKYTIIYMGTNHIDNINLQDKEIVSLVKLFLFLGFTQTGVSEKNKIDIQTYNELEKLLQL